MWNAVHYVKLSVVLVSLWSAVFQVDVVCLNGCADLFEIPHVREYAARGQFVAVQALFKFKLLSLSDLLTRFQRCIDLLTAGTRAVIPGVQKSAQYRIGVTPFFGNRAGTASSVQFWTEPEDPGVPESPEVLMSFFCEFHQVSFSCFAQARCPTA